MNGLLDDDRPPNKGCLDASLAFKGLALVDADCNDDEDGATNEIFANGFVFGFVLETDAGMLVGFFTELGVSVVFIAVVVGVFVDVVLELNGLCCCFWYVVALRPLA